MRCSKRAMLLRSGTCSTFACVGLHMNRDLRSDRGGACFVTFIKEESSGLGGGNQPTSPKLVSNSRR